jgi:hypothetical protein
MLRGIQTRGSSAATANPVTGWSILADHRAGMVSRTRSVWSDRRTQSDGTASWRVQRPGLIRRVCITPGDLITARRDGRLRGMRTPPRNASRRRERLLVLLVGHGAGTANPTAPARHAGSVPVMPVHANTRTGHYVHRPEGGAIETLHRDQHGSKPDYRGRVWR